MRFTRFKQIKI